jgi:hypothetical protein
MNGRLQENGIHESTAKLSAHVPDQSDAHTRSKILRYNAVPTNLSMHRMHASRSPPLALLALALVFPVGVWPFPAILGLAFLPFAEPVVPTRVFTRDAFCRTKPNSQF